MHTITGPGDMLCRVVARTNADLQRVLDAIVSTEGVVRSATLISLATQVPYRVLPLVRQPPEPVSISVPPELGRRVCAQVGEKATLHWWTSASYCRNCT